MMKKRERSPASRGRRKAQPHVILAWLVLEEGEGVYPLENVATTESHSAFATAVLEEKRKISHL